MLPPHYHPNAVNYVVAILGNTTTYMYQENGARLVTEVLTPGHATIFPRASMHMMMNTGTFDACDLFFPFPFPSTSHECNPRPPPKEKAHECNLPPSFHRTHLTRKPH